MPYTAKLKNNMDQLVKVIDSAGLPASIVWSFDEGKGKNEFLTIEVLPSALIPDFSGAIIRTYPFQINYYMNLSGSAKQILDTLSRRIDKLERALNDNANRTVSSVYYWHNGEVLDVELDSDIEDFEEGLNVGRLTFEVTTLEVI